MAGDDDIAFKALLDTADFDAGMEVMTGALRAVGEIAVNAFLEAGKAVADFAAESFQSALENEKIQTRLGTLLQSTAQAAEDQALAYANAQGKFVEGTAASQDQLDTWNSKLLDAQASLADLNTNLADKEPSEKQKRQLEKLNATVAEMEANIASGSQTIRTSLVDALGLIPPVAAPTIEDLNALATQFKGLAGGTDDTILAIEEMALRMGTISKDQMPTFIQTTLDLAAATGQDAVSAARLLAQAQDDPISALGRFNKMGIKFTEQQKKQIKTLQDSGDTAGAMAIIMDRLGAATGGAAAAQAGTLAGQWEILKNTLGEAGETAMTALLPALHALTDNVLPVLVPLIDKTATAVGEFFSALLTGQDPIQLISDAFYQLGYNLEILTGIPGLNNFFSAIGDQIVSLAPLLQSLPAALQQLVVNAQTGFANFMTAIQPVITAAGNLATVFLASLPMIEQTVLNMVTFVQAQFASFLPVIVANVSSALNTIAAFWQAHGAEVMAIIQIASEFITVTIGGALTLVTAIVAGALNSINAIWTAGTQLLTGNWAGAQKTIVDILIANFGIMTSAFTTFFNAALSIVGTNLTEFTTVWQGTFSLAEQIITTVWGNIEATIAAAVASVLISINGIIGAIQDFINKITSIPPLPDWLTPGSPTPLETGLWGIADAMHAVTNSLPALNLAPSVSTVTNTTTDARQYNLTNNTRETARSSAQSFYHMRAMEGV